jgi:chromosome partitioning protein
MIIAIVNQKGGVGKTTTAVNLAAALAEAGQRVRLFDLDIQEDAGSFAESFQGGGLSIDAATTTARALPGELKKSNDCDFVLLDCPPKLGEEMAAALKVADLAIVPINGKYSALRGLARVMDTIQAARRSGNIKLRTRVLLTMLDRRTEHARTIEAEAARLFGRELFRTRITIATAFDDAFEEGQSLLQYDPRHPGAQAYRELAAEIRNEARKKL